MGDLEETEFDWNTIPTTTARFIFDQGTMFLQGQKDFLIASDQRSMTFAGIMTALTTASLGVALLGEDKTSTALVIASSAAALLSGLSAFCALVAARPGTFNYPAVRPGERLHLASDWLMRPENVLLIGEAYIQQQHIEANGVVLAGLTGWYKRALILAGLTPVLALLAAVVGWAAGA